MAAITVQTVNKSGVAANLVAASGGGDTFVNDASELTLLMVRNGGGSSINVTIAVVPSNVNTTSYGQLSVSSTVVAVAAGATVVIGPFRQILYNNSSGLVSVTYSNVTSVTVAALKIDKQA